MSTAHTTVTATDLADKVQDLWLRSKSYERLWFGPEGELIRTTVGDGCPADIYLGHVPVTLSLSGGIEQGEEVSEAWINSEWNDRRDELVEEIQERLDRNAYELTEAIREAVLGMVDSGETPSEAEVVSAVTAALHEGEDEFGTRIRRTEVAQIELDAIAEAVADGLAAAIAATLEEVAS